ncbi:putative N-acylmannosamine kinase [Microbacterium sp. 8M]|nr:putative N-acylmannosamine kinase [Microbacterium sp. 8M]
MNHAVTSRLPDLSRNGIAVLHALRGEESLTVADLAERIGVSRPTAAAGAAELEDAGWAINWRADSQGMGRPAKHFALRVSAGAVVGVDMGLHSIRAVVHDLEEKLLADHRVPNQEGGTARQLDLLRATIHEALHRAGDPPLLALGVGLPGVVDRTGRVVIGPARSGWDGLPLRDRLLAAYDCPILVENDAMAAASAEHQWGAGRGASSFVYLLGGHRTSSAIVVEGRVLRGANGAAGMVGELPELEWDDATRMLLDDAGVTGDDMLSVFQRANEGDARSSAAIAGYVDRLSVGLAAVSLAVDPELVVLGGGISRVGDMIAPLLQERLHARARIIAPRIETSPLGGEATVRGAAHLAFAAVDEELQRAAQKAT